MEATTLGMHGGVPSASVSEAARATHKQAMEKREKTYMRKRKRIEAGQNPKPVTVSAGSTLYFANGLSSPYFTKKCTFSP